MTAARRARVVVAAAALTALTVDVAAKAAASAWLADGPVRLGPLLTLRLVHNRGIAFGVAAAAPTPVVLAVTAAIAVLIAVLAWRGGLGAPVPAGLIVGGALANVADRATGGSVVDFLDVGRWPTFNLADVFLVAGIAMLLVTTGRGTPSTDRNVVRETTQESPWV
jgi:signal peptidase II